MCVANVLKGLQNEIWALFMDLPAILSVVFLNYKLLKQLNTERRQKRLDSKAMESLMLHDSNDYGRPSEAYMLRP